MRWDAPRRSGNTKMTGCMIAADRGVRDRPCFFRESPFTFERNVRQAPAAPRVFGAGRNRGMVRKPDRLPDEKGYSSFEHIGEPGEPLSLVETGSEPAGGRAPEQEGRFRGRAAD